MTLTNIKLKEKLLADYNFLLDYSGVSGERLATRLEEISNIGLTNEEGSNRLGLSNEENDAKLLIKKWMEDLGLIIRVDGIGNLFGRLEGKSQQDSIIMTGSHVDTVPNGGHFDGVLGVLSALEVIEAWNKEGYSPEKNIEVAVFTNEEGGRINKGCLGSRVMMGELDKKELLKLSDFAGVPFEKIIAENNLSFNDINSSKDIVEKMEAFFEVHIEQGKQLEKNNLSVGAVTGIAGSCRLKITFKGETGHAGNTPMNDRKDALLTASRFISEVERLPKTISSSAVATVGKLDVFPNGANVIPGTVDLIVDIRDIIEDQRDQLVDLVIEEAKKISEVNKMNLYYEKLHQLPCLSIQLEMQNKIEKSIIKSGVTPYSLPSGAGHDSLVIGQQVPVGMIFVRSKDGHSHTPKEWSTLNDCVQGVHVLKELIELQNKE